MTEPNSVVSLVRGYASRLKKPSSPIAISVLVVDDEEPVRKFVGRVLKDAGYRITIASDGPEAIRMADNVRASVGTSRDDRTTMLDGRGQARRERLPRPHPYRHRWQRRWRSWLHRLPPAETMWQGRA